MSGERELAVLLRSMQPSLGKTVFVYCTFPQEQPAPAGLDPVMTFREAEGLTLVLPGEQAAAAGLAGAFPSRMITLGVHSALEAVGFLAEVTSRLAHAGISVNPVAAFHHDHLFVPADRAEEAMQALRELAESDDFARNGLHLQGGASI